MHIIYQHMSITMHIDMPNVLFVALYLLMEKSTIDFVNFKI